MSRSNFVFLRPILLFFIFTNALFVAGKTMLVNWGIDRSVVLIANLVLFVLNIISFLLSRKSLNSANPNVFVRAMYTNFMLKLFVCIAMAFIYFKSVNKDVNKPALFISMGLYVVYTFIEVSALTKLLRKKKNA
jgi:hypothetical protein